MKTYYIQKIDGESREGGGGGGGGVFRDAVCGGRVCVTKEGSERPSPALSQQTQKHAASDHGCQYRH